MMRPMAPSAFPLLDADMRTSPRRSRALNPECRRVGKDSAALDLRPLAEEHLHQTAVPSAEVAIVQTARQRSSRTIAEAIEESREAAELVFDASVGTADPIQRVLSDEDLEKTEEEGKQRG
jgi:hypothetical protein